MSEKSLLIAFYTGCLMALAALVWGIWAFTPYHALTMLFGSMLFGVIATGAIADYRRRHAP